MPSVLHFSAKLSLFVVVVEVLARNKRIRNAVPCFSKTHYMYFTDGRGGWLELADNVWQSHFHVIKLLPL